MRGNLTLDHQVLIPPDRRGELGVSLHAEPEVVLGMQRQAALSKRAEEAIDGDRIVLLRLLDRLARAVLRAVYEREIVLACIPGRELVDQHHHLADEVTTGRRVDDLDVDLAIHDADLQLRAANQDRSAFTPRRMELPGHSLDVSQRGGECIISVIRS